MDQQMSDNLFTAIGSSCSALKDAAEKVWAVQKLAAKQRFDSPFSQALETASKAVYDAWENTFRAQAQLASVCCPPQSPMQGWAAVAQCIASTLLLIEEAARWLDLGLMAEPPGIPASRWLAPSANFVRFGFSELSVEQQLSLAGTKLWEAWHTLLDGSETVEQLVTRSCAPQPPE